MTVEELITELKKYSKDLTIFSTGTDSGGYDAVFVNDLIICMGDKHPTIAKDDFFSEFKDRLYVGGVDEME